MNKRRIVVTGSTGYLGNAFVNEYQDKYDIYCVVRKKSNINNLKILNCTVIAYQSTEELYDILERISPEVLVHFAGVFLNEHNQNTILEMLECNLVFGTVIADAAVKAGCKNIVNTSSYWQNYHMEEYNPVNLYAATKQGYEDILRYYAEAADCKVTTLTIFDTYGPKDNRRKVLNLISEMQNGQKIDMSSGNQKMYYTYVDDITSAYDIAIERCIKGIGEKYEKFALRDEEPLSLKSIVERYVKISGKNIRLEWGILPNRQREISDPTNIGRVLPSWKPKNSIETGLKKMIDVNEKEKK